MLILMLSVVEARAGKLIHAFVSRFPTPDGLLAADVSWRVVLINSLLKALTVDLRRILVCEVA